MNPDNRVAHRWAAGCFPGCSFFCWCCDQCLCSGLTFSSPFDLPASGLLRCVCVANQCVFLLLAGDFLSPPAMEPAVNKELSSSSSAIHSSERGKEPSRSNQMYVFFSLTWSLSISGTFLCVCPDPSVSFVFYRTASPSNHRSSRSSSNRRSTTGLAEETSRARTPTVRQSGC